ncbi:hypothetical protein D1631_05795 [Chryseobacterium nematophagum]|uniref:Uncharacterized protein n=1 Tax=Chryseobacterium nematophagum TaxID=2305228 RepID=A0A3M7TFS1_9FLAO|nr:hypothetical protein D1631_05795 [Chryseobacterium nematophagum]
MKYSSNLLLCLSWGKSILLRYSNHTEYHKAMNSESYKLGRKSSSGKSWENVKHELKWNIVLSKLKLIKL